MTSALQTQSRMRAFDIPDLTDKVVRLIRTIAPPVVVQLIARIALALPFWRSGVLKWDGFLQINDTAVTLFSDEFMLHLPGGPYHFPAPSVFAFLSGSVEIILPILLILGLGSRLAALGLLFMTLVVQLTELGGWPIHLTWAAMALSVMAWGPGALSFDALIARFWRRAEARGAALE